MGKGQAIEKRVYFDFIFEVLSLKAQGSHLLPDLCRLLIIHFTDYSKN